MKYPLAKCIVYYFEPHVEYYIYSLIHALLYNNNLPNANEIVNG